MTEIFVHKDFTVVGFYRSILEEAGIPCLIRNETSQNLITELTVMQSFPALCVARDEDAERAVEILREYKMAQPEPAEDWKCPSCGEEVPGEFGSCWKCQHDRPAPSA